MFNNLQNEKFCNFFFAKNLNIKMQLDNPFNRNFRKFYRNPNGKKLLTFIRNPKTPTTFSTGFLKNLPNILPKVCQKVWL